MFSASPHMGSRDIAVPEPKTLIAAGQHVLTFKTPFIPAGYYGAICRMEKAAFYEVEERKRDFQVNFD